MRASLVMRAVPGFWRRTLDHAVRQTTMAVKSEGLHEPTKPFPLVQFSSANIITHCKSMSDKGIGGFSTASLTYEPGNTPAVDLTRPAKSVYNDLEALQNPEVEPPHMRFSGNISTELPRNNPSVQRTGFAGWRTLDMGWSMFGKVIWDLGQYANLTLRVKSDGRKYFINVQTDSLVPTDIHQHILPTTTRGTWEIITIPFSDFVRTNHGIAIKPQNEMNTQKVRSVGISSTDRIQGPFELRIAEIFASNVSGRRMTHGEEDADEEPLGILETPGTKSKPGEPEKILI